ncbi:glucuronoxylan 4-O-methyltransferase 2 isoform X2 [Diospyros lotus]|uniref:glucuronoxylan 4-O-methyltransferase 2 isoform X2 n=1 Tax=Diospyros lotus TaxID=55363 RepID=UPI0022569899|nr:glucuronoxylan 4-O-methyltransferase 2 isoform X2 [Diospyros lotus]
MPPEVSPCHPVVTPLIQFLPQEPSRSNSNRPPFQTKFRGTKRMLITKKKLIPLLIFVLSACRMIAPPTRGPSNSLPISSSSAANLTEKEYHLLSNIISLRAPCSLLFFGLEPQYVNLSASVNAGGTTVFLEDDPEKLSTIRTNYSNTKIYRVEYKTLARDAYKLLKEGRQNPACALQSGPLRQSSCPLALTRLPRKVYKQRWDVLVVDGPRGDAPDAPGRMAAIYTAAMMARAGNITDVVVHDVDRMVEKWFAWEFLCDENLVSSKGKLWNFRIAGRSNTTKFCPATTTLAVS